MKWLKEAAVYQIFELLIKDNEFRNYVILTLGLIMFFSMLIISVNTATQILIQLYK